MAKTITVQDETWQMLTRLKADLMNGDLDQTIKYLFYELNKKEVKDETINN